jgi:hypothetical protein
VRELLTGKPDLERQALEPYREAAELFAAGLRPLQVGALLGVNGSTASSFAGTWNGRPYRFRTETRRAAVA